MRGGAGALFVLLAVAGCTVEPRTDVPTQGSARPADLPEPARYREVVQPEGSTPLPILSAAIRNGDVLWLSGQIGIVPGITPPTLVEGGVEGETRQVFENIQAVLDAAGLSLANVIKCTVFLADIRDYPAVNAVYATYFEGMAPPARSALAVSALALGARVEIECVAAYPPGT